MLALLSAIQYDATFKPKVCYCAAFQPYARMPSMNAANTNGKQSTNGKSAKARKVLIGIAIFFGLISIAIAGWSIRSHILSKPVE